MTRAIRLREKLSRGELIVGGHVFLTDPEVTESLGMHGFEFVWIDAEHSAFDRTEILAHVVAAAAADTASFVRVAWNDPVIIKPVIEMGPDGIILPMVSTAEEARAAVAACRYPPAGVRGFGPRRANAYGAVDTADYLAHADERLLKIMQIEHVRAVENLEEILTVPGVDLIIVGPNDLSASVGHLGDTRHPDVIALYDQIERVAKRMKKPFGVSLGAGDRVSIEDWVRRGAALIGCGDDLSYLSMGSKATLSYVRGLAR